MENHPDIVMAERYEQEATEDEQRAAEAERCLPSYSEASREVCKSYISARKSAAGFARGMARLHRERANSK